MTLMYWARGAPIAAAETAVMVIALEGARRWAVARPDGSRLVAGTHLWLGIGALAMVGNAVTVGQGQAVTMWFFCAVPMLAAQLASERAATQWLPITVAAFLLVHSLQLFANVRQEFVPTGGERLVAQVVMAVALYFFAVSQRRTVARQLDVIRAQANDLEVARDEALAASRAKSTFLANMSHELRTPLHGVLASLDLLGRDAALIGDASRRLEIAVASAEQTRRVVDQILDLARIDDGAAACDEVTFSASEVVRQAVEVVQAVADQKCLEITVTVAPEIPPYLHGDALKLRQVLVNLVDNAVKFTDAGSVAVDVSWAGDHAVFSVCDTGIGLNSADCSRLFDKFEQLDSSTTRRFGGTGLGLAISKELADVMGGHITVESNPGDGSCFRLSTPLRAAASGSDIPNNALPPMTPLRRSTAPPMAVRGPAGGPLVLVVDDNATNAELALDVLDELGCRSLWVADGHDASTQLELRDDVAALLLDSHLPGLHGNEVARRARARNTHPQLTIVMLTADVSSENVAGAFASGADLCLAKPARLRDIRAALRQAGVLRPPFDVRPIEAALALVERDADDRLHPDVQALVRQAHEDAVAFTAGLRSDPAVSHLFDRAHGRLVGSLAYGLGLLESGCPEGEGRRFLHRCLETAISWEDA